MANINDDFSKSTTIALLNQETRLALSRLNAQKLSDKRSKNLTVHDEDTYIQNLEKIIERDFFPDLEKLKLQQSYLQALKSEDFETVRDILCKLNDLNDKKNQNEDDSEEPLKKVKVNMNRLYLPYSNDEPPEFVDQNDLQQSNEKTRAKINNKDLPGLDSYMSKNTSEDNISFEVLMSESQKKERSKMHNSWLQEKELLQKIKQENLLRLGNGEETKMIENAKSSENASLPVETWTYKAKNTLMYAPEGVDFTLDEQRERLKKVRAINHSNTRFNADPAVGTANAAATTIGDDSLFKKPQQLSLINVIPKVGIDGQEIKKETPKIRGYSFVEASPSPMPGAMPGDESPMMTWGQIESTPIRLDPSSTPLRSTAGLPEFRINDITDREKIARELEEKASAARRKRKAEAIQHVQRGLMVTPSPMSSTPGLTPSSSRSAAMSPAAQLLLSKKLLTSNRAGSTSLASGSFSNKTPSSSASSTPSSVDRLKGLVRPTSSKAAAITQQQQQPLFPSASADLTSDLLKLPKTN